MRRAYNPPTPAPPLFAPRTPRTARPLALLPLALADVAYTAYYIAHHAAPAQIPPYLPLLSLVRAGVLLGLGLSLRWRARGGWLLAASGGSLIAGSWAACGGIMRRERVEVEYLCITAGIAVFEYIFYLLLVRLTPSRLFALRGPPPLRSPSLAPLAPLSPALTPLPGRSRRQSSAVLCPTPGAGVGAGAGAGAGTGTGAQTPVALARSPLSQSADSNGAGFQHGFSAQSGFPSSPSQVHSSRSPSAPHSHSHSQSRRASARSPLDRHLEASFAAPREEDEDGSTLSLPPALLDPARLSPTTHYAALGLGRPAEGDADVDVEAEGEAGFPESYGYATHDHSYSYDGYDGYGYYGDGYDSDSSISESSIIDLPRATLAPLELESLEAMGVAGLVGVAAGVGAVGAAAGAAAGAAVDIASGAGELVRRSASARFLGRSVGSDEGRERGYGTFGRGAAGGRGGEPGRPGEPPAGA